VTNTFYFAPVTTHISNIQHHQQRSQKAYTTMNTLVHDLNSNAGYATLTASTMTNSFMFSKFSFPFKLHHLLDEAEKNNRQWASIISWTPSGRAFKIHKPKEFAALVMPRYFDQTKYRSFQRQLYIYGFDRIRKSKTTSDEEAGAYSHKLLVRGSAELCLDMTRTKIKGTGMSNAKRQERVRAQSNITATITTNSSSNNNENDHAVMENNEQADIII